MRFLTVITVAIPESRFAGEFRTLFERTGAEVLACPLLKESVTEDRSSTHRFIDLAIAETFDLTIFMTGIGTNLILREAESLGKREALLGALERMTIVSRGSKSTAALRKASVRIDMIPKAATTEGLIEVLQSHDLRERNIAVQLYGTPNPMLCDALTSQGGHVFPISVYTYVRASDASHIELFVHDIIAGKAQVIVFTSAPQVHALFDAAITLGLEPALQGSLTRHVQVASIGEVTTRALAAHHIQPHIVPDEPKMGPMVKAICTSRLS
jgi:uroporphyrinogen-III synthase